VAVAAAFVALIGVVVGGAARRASAQSAPERLDRGRFTAIYFPSERTLAHSLIDEALRTDSFPGLPRPTQHVLLAIAPDRRHFRDWVGPGAPEWGAAITFPDSRRIVMQGRSAGSDAGDPREVLRHELAHLALHEYLGDLPPRWFDEGYASYAAREWNREDALTANVALALRGTPRFSDLDSLFEAGASSARDAYALSYRAVVELAALDPGHGLADYFVAWKREGDMDRAMRSTFGMTLDGFEKRWQQRTRRRYGALAVIGDLAFGGAVLLVVVVPLYFARRQRDRRRMAEMREADEAAEKAARESILAALMHGDDETDFGAEPTGRPPP